MDFDEIVANAIPYGDNFKDGDTLTIGEWSRIINQWAERKGWNKDLKDKVGDQFANFHSEISEAWEEWRSGHKWNDVYYNFDLCNCGVPIGHVGTLELHSPGCPGTKPEGIPIELADTVIRILHTCGFYGIDLEGMIKLKMMFNETREIRHGGKRA